METRWRPCGGTANCSCHRPSGWTRAELVTFLLAWTESDTSGRPRPLRMNRPISPVPPPADAAPGLSAEAVEALAQRSVRRDSASSFQALLAAASAAVGALLAPVRTAEEAALSLRQRERLGAVAADLVALRTALGAGVSKEARCLERRRPAEVVRAVLRPSPGWLPRLRERAADRPSSAPRPTWLASAAAAVEALGQTADHLATLAAAQRPRSSARDLGECVAARLRAHRDTVLADVARLVD